MLFVENMFNFCGLGECYRFVADDVAFGNGQVIAERDRVNLRVPVPGSHFHFQQPVASAGRENGSDLNSLVRGFAGISGMAGCVARLGLRDR